MRPMLFAAAMITAASVLANTDAMARDYAWCSVDSGDAGGNCSFVTHEHCLATIAGIGGCMPNVFAAASGRPRSLQSRPARKNFASAKHNSAKHDAAKRAATRYVSTKAGSSKHSTVQSAKRATNKHSSPTGEPAKQVTPPANPGASTPPMSATFIPLPDPALLTPPPEFDCEYKSVGLDAAGAQAQSLTGGQTEATPDAAQRMTLDYERQCYQHAATIVREHLQQLQASVGKTIKAVNDGR
jgi:hypothetical protein